MSISRFVGKLGGEREIFRGPNTSIFIDRLQRDFPHCCGTQDGTHVTKAIHPQRKLQKERKLHSDPSIPSDVHESQVLA